MQDVQQAPDTAAMSNYNAALIDCNAALDLQPGSVKALFRKAQALQGLHRPGEAFAAATEAMQKASAAQAAGIAPLVNELAQQVGRRDADELD